MILFSLFLIVCQRKKLIFGWWNDTDISPADTPCQCQSLLPMMQMILAFWGLFAKCQQRRFGFDNSDFKSGLFCCLIAPDFATVAVVVWGPHEGHGPTVGRHRREETQWSQKLDDGKKLHSTAQNSCFCQPTHCHRVLWVLFSVKNWGWNWGLNLVCLKQQSVHVCHDKHNAAYPNFWHTCFVLHMTMWMSTFSWHSMSESVGVQCKQLKLAGGFCVFHTK